MGDIFLEGEVHPLTDRCVLLNWFIHCFIHWGSNCAWYQDTYPNISWFIFNSMILQ